MIDTVRMNLFAGKGGNGCVSFLHEKFNPKGGPNGGDGGHGGDIIIESDNSLNTLLHLKFNSTIYGINGQHGKGKEQRGSNAKDTTIYAPLGTVIWKMNSDGVKTFVADLDQDKKVLVAKGGLGGWGNQRFVSSTNQEPLLAQTGEKGEETVLFLELKLLADVGLLAKPNAGKSTFISRSTKAKPKIADYQFTTLEPVLGVVEYGNNSFVMMEIPGLIEGANEGVGLGFQFLRHAERARFYVHLIDGLSENHLKDWEMINNEIKQFDESMAKKPQILAVTKMDVTEVNEYKDMIFEVLKERIEEHNDDLVVDETVREIMNKIHFISSVSGEGLNSLIGDCNRLLELMPKETEQYEFDENYFPPVETVPVITELEDGVFVVNSKRLERLTSMSDMEDHRVAIQIWSEMIKMGISKHLEESGIQPGDVIKIGNAEMEWI
ncbi:MAG: GTPase ObgE [Dehalococcoidia bacterium]|nr:GTPase ObgE [Chloroflexota bacterium]|tara:strand:+ start:7922 stop:9232 length:1311 start_codon:yes stop_codon:yes gene_type:complete